MSAGRSSVCKSISRTVAACTHLSPARLLSAAEWTRSSQTLIRFGQAVPLECLREGCWKTPWRVNKQRLWCAACPERKQPYLLGRDKNALVGSARVTCIVQRQRPCDGVCDDNIAKVPANGAVK
jgi:hypothetical protein